MCKIKVGERTGKDSWAKEGRDEEKEENMSGERWKNPRERKGRGRPG
jgi:hypothetical protein